MVFATDTHEAPYSLASNRPVDEAFGESSWGLRGASDCRPERCGLGININMARSPEQPVSTDRGRQRRSEILEAARQVFEDVGYASATVSEIVRTSGGSRASFYSYFSSADAVLEELVREMVDELLEASTRPVEPGVSPYATLLSTIEQFMAAYRERAPLLAVLDQATMASETFRSIRLEVRTRFAQVIARSLGDGQRPDPDGLDVTTMAIALGGMVEDLARGRFLLGYELSDREAHRTLAVIWARTLGLPTPGPSADVTRTS